jgi:tRNA A-37 threonylcarbamoyl transferase component Bud32
MPPTDPQQPVLPLPQEGRSGPDKSSGLSLAGEAWIPELRQVSFVQEGGQAQVFRALDQEGRWVAVKVLHMRAQHDRAMQRRLRKEAELMRGFDHPCILPLYRDGVLPDGRPYLISPWLDGLCLRELPTSLTPSQMANFLADVLDAVGHAHQAGVLHRDLHPRNLFMTQRFRACVLDFGVAKIAGQSAAESETRDGQLLGVERYSAPEVLRYGSKHASAASDVFSLGLVLKEFAARFQSVGLPGELDRLLRFCCAPSGGGRYRDAHELASAFRMWRNRMRVPAPCKRGLSARYVIAAAPLLLGLAIPLLTPPAPGRLDSGTWPLHRTSLVERGLPLLAEFESTEFLAQQEALLEAASAVDALLAAYDTGEDLAQSNVRRAACDRVAAQLESLALLPESAADLLNLLSFQVGCAELDALLVPTVLAGDAIGFRMAPISNQELQVLRAQRDQPLARLLEGSRSSRPAMEAEFRCLMQEARLPQSHRLDNGTDPLIGWTRMEAARFSKLLEQMEKGGAPTEWLVLGKARRSLNHLQSALGWRQASFRIEIQEEAKRIATSLQQIPNQQAFEVRHMRAELAEILEN